MQEPRSRGEPLCRWLGHRFAFAAQGREMTWECTRCGERASKRYDTPADAARFAAAFNRSGTEGLGRRAPLIGLLPLRVWRWWKEATGRVGR